MPRVPLDRRRFLAGLGTLLALPLLPSLWARSARADSTQPRRLVVWYVPNGFYMPDWTPQPLGSTYSLSPLLEPLAPVRQHVSLLTGLGNAAAATDTVDPHARGTATILTCHPVQKASVVALSSGISVDQVVAQDRGHLTPIASLQVGLESGNAAGVCGQDYSCAYYRDISWAGPTSPLPKLSSPRALFDRLFAGEDPDASAQARQVRLADRLSVLDVVREDLTALRPRLDASDRLRLDDFTNGIREVEKGLQAAALAPGCAHGAQPQSLLDMPAAMTAMTDLIVTALACDLTRVVTFMQGNGASPRTFPFVGAPGNHHSLSHHDGDPAALAQLRKIGTWEVQQFAAFVQRLAQTPDAQGQPLLATTTVLFVSEVGEGNTHDFLELPVLLAGPGGGWHAPGRYLAFQPGTPIARLYRTWLEQGFGMPPQPFGVDGDGVLAGLAG